MSAAAVDSYLATLPDAQRACLADLRQRLRALLPDADEVISYAMPGFRLQGKMVAGYAGFARHCGFYPHSGGVIPSFAAELAAAGFRTSKSGVTFTPDHPLPDALLGRILDARLAEAGLPPRSA
ncbi:MAG: DUF1801 domain-containing protein [Limimaricola sp.]|uniref:iron chaperone n=1 Tax=Limimaricola sp. TaxID=2211665 RepID=UPI001D9BB074|nr:DUF1801 domain-containing protein [Limimaricola sp.]MBI1418460.1 DUF1801 domain-containing protein [Limimaricola sp.]